MGASALEAGLGASADGLDEAALPFWSGIGLRCKLPAESLGLASMLLATAIST